MNCLTALKKGFVAGKRAFKQELMVKEVFKEAPKPDFIMDRPLFNGKSRGTEISLAPYHLKKKNWILGIRNYGNYYIPNGDWIIKHSVRRMMSGPYNCYVLKIKDLEVI
jgi:hypothetical protein